MPLFTFSIRSVLLLPVLAMIAFQVAYLVVEKQRLNRGWREFAATEFCTPGWVFDVQNEITGELLGRVHQYSSRSTIVEPGVYRIQRQGVQWVFAADPRAPFAVTLNAGYFLAVQVGLVMTACASLIPVALRLFGRSAHSLSFTLCLPICVLLTVLLLYSILGPPRLRDAGIMLTVEAPNMLTNIDTGEVHADARHGMSGHRLGEGIYRVRRIRPAAP